MEENEIILGRVSLNAYEIKGKKGPTPVIEILADDCASDGEILVLQVIRTSK